MPARRLLLAAVLVVAAAVTVAIAGPPVTVVLTNGQQYSGSLVYNNNSVGVLTDNGGQLNWPQNQVAVIEFQPGQPSQQELSQLQSSNRGNTFLGGLIRGRNVVVALQDGEVINGSLNGISNDGSRVTITTTSNQVDNFLANDIARLYLNPSAAQNLYASAGLTQGAVGTSGQFGQYGRSVGALRIPANQPWTQTGITVHQGESLVFQVSGQVKWGPSQANLVGPDGGTPQGSSDVYPVPGTGVGALIGRVGNSQPFAIGSSSQPVVMPADGQLFLGINDNYFNDNSGSFSVRISQVGG